SVLHELAWRGRLEPEDAALARAGVQTLPIRRRQPRDLRARAWEIADRMGWAKTYDAEYCALADLLGCPLVTGDGGLRGSTGRMLDVLTPREAAERLSD
ncbi:MAG: type II toxin-antitoxin system VapC family toxin, partial [Thermoleophilia bacterium]|nr:type II toxin-antitoxin system VapC family toxin [Thermoleophilia bacterium]